MTRVRTTGIVVTEVKEAPFTYQGNRVAIVPFYNHEIAIIIMIIITAIIIMIIITAIIIMIIITAIIIMIIITAIIIMIIITATIIIMIIITAIIIIIIIMIIITAIIIIMIIIINNSNINVDLDSFYLGILYLSPFLKSLLKLSFFSNLSNIIENFDQIKYTSVRFSN